MKIGFEQRWTAPVDNVIALYTDESFWSGVTGFETTSAPEVIEVNRTDTQARTRLRWRLSVDLPREASRFIDPNNVAWVENTLWDLDAQTATVAFEPVQASALLRASAIVKMIQDGDDCVRRITGDLSVRIPLLGHKVENAINDGIGEHLGEEADVVAARLDI